MQFIVGKNHNSHAADAADAAAAKPNIMKPDISAAASVRGLDNLRLLLQRRDFMVCC